VARLILQGTPYFAGQEGEATPSDLQSNKLAFIDTDLPHNDVVSKRQECCEYLKTRCFEKLE
jgi:hypothetical protein